MYGMYWHNQPDSFAFTRWLFNHPKVMAERAEIMECMEAMLWEHDAAIRKKFFERELLLIDSIDDVLSVAIVIKRTDMRGKSMWPWLHV
jgi:hypothetical protein